MNPQALTCTDLTFRVKTLRTRLYGGRAARRRCSFLRETTPRAWSRPFGGAQDRLASRTLEHAQLPFLG